MEYKVTSVQPKLDKSTGEIQQDNYGNKRYTVFVTDPTHGIISFTKAVKQTPPLVGDTLQGTITQESGTYGPYFKFTAERTAFGGNHPSTPSRDPEESQRIMRQHASMDALAFLQIKVASMKKEDISSITVEKVFAQAERFLSYYQEGMPKSGSEVFASRNEDPDEPEEDYSNIEF